MTLCWILHVPHGLLNHNQGWILHVPPGYCMYPTATSAPRVSTSACCSHPMPTPTHRGGVPSHAPTRRHDPSSCGIVSRRSAPPNASSTAHQVTRRRRRQEEPGTAARHGDGAPLAHGAGLVWPWAARQARRHHQGVPPARGRELRRHPQPGRNQGGRRRWRVHGGWGAATRRLSAREHAGGH